MNAPRRHHRPMPSRHMARKRFGQYFLRDQQVIQRIIHAIQPTTDDHLVEIGPGLGALTVEMLKQVGKIEVVEFDRDIIPKLVERCQPLGELIVHQADALTFDFIPLVEGQKKIRLFGNLPYNISTPLLFHLMEQIDGIQDMHFMLQKEVVDRIVAEPGNKTYGRLSVMLQYHCQVEALFSVPPTAFTPRPQVQSMVLRLIPLQAPIIKAKNQSNLADVVKQAFSQRRKTLHNSLRGWLSDDDWQALEIDPQARPEQLSVEDFVRISNQYT